MTMTRDLILQTIEQNVGKAPLTEGAIKNLLGLTYDRVHNSVKRLLNAGTLVRTVDGWLLLPSAEAPVVDEAPVGLAQAVRARVGKAPVRTLRKKVVRTLLLVDDSVSMTNVATATLISINKTLADIKEQAAKFSDQETTLSYYKFSNYVDPIYRLWPAQNIREVASFHPRGDSTKLFDGVKQIIEDHSLNGDLVYGHDTNVDVSYLLIVITDGKENDSILSWAGFKSLIEQTQATDKFTLTFLLPPGAKRSFVRDYGVPEGNVEEWTLDARGVQRATEQRTVGIGNYFSAVDAGATKSTTFYVETDLSKLKSETVRKRLTDIRDQVKVFEVKKEEDIQPFMQRNTGRPYMPGTAFYQLTKKEAKVQPGKKVLLREKNQKSIYAGSDARQLLGLPDGQDARVKPGNHSSYDVFIQSKSNNRALVRGTDVIYWSRAQS
jgi:hypothetical protein